LDRIRARLREDPAKPESPGDFVPRVDGELLPGQTLADLFEQQVLLAGGHLHRVESLELAGQAFGNLVRELDLVRIARSDSLHLRELCAAAPDIEWLEPSPFPTSREERGPLFNAQAGLTSAQLAIAESGTLGLDSSVERHRLASLVPPVHIALLFARDIRRGMGEALASFADSPPPTLTFITGPSRTADIELELVVGVHGPRELHVLLVDPADGA
jgi:L-lactate utilization protein LutC